MRRRRQRPVIFLSVNPAGGSTLHLEQLRLRRIAAAAATGCTNRRLSDTDDEFTFTGIDLFEDRMCLIFDPYFSFTKMQPKRIKQSRWVSSSSGRHISSLGMLS
ncbi:hypothetical protein INR49_004521 [Caranx melampygus]|nr:hypothetical protein INR49_004521 [Caranx melampygus]